MKKAKLEDEKEKGGGPMRYKTVFTKQSSPLLNRTVESSLTFPIPSSCFSYSFLVVKSGSLTNKITTEWPPLVYSKYLIQCYYTCSKQVQIYIKAIFQIFFFFFFFCFLGPCPWHMEVPRLGIKSELQLPAYATTIATWDLCRICDLHHSSQQCWILNPLSKTRDRIRILKDPSQLH